MVAAKLSSTVLLLAWLHVAQATDAHQEDKRALFGLLPDSPVELVGKLVVAGKLQAQCSSVLANVVATKTATVTPTATVTSTKVATVYTSTTTSTQVIPKTSTTQSTATSFSGVSTITSLATTTTVETSTLSQSTEAAYVQGPPLRMLFHKRGGGHGGHLEERGPLEQLPMAIRAFATSIVYSGCASALKVTVPWTKTLTGPAATSTAVVTSTTKLVSTTSASVDSTSVVAQVTTVDGGPSATTTEFSTITATTTTDVQPPTVTARCPAEATFDPNSGTCRCNALNTLYVGTSCVTCASLGRTDSNTQGYCAEQCLDSFVNFIPNLETCLGMGLSIMKGKTRCAVSPTLGRPLAFSAALVAEGPASDAMVVTCSYANNELCYYGYRGLGLGNPRYYYSGTSPLPYFNYDYMYDYDRPEGYSGDPSQGDEYPYYGDPIPAAFLERCPSLLGQASAPTTCYTTCPPVNGLSVHAGYVGGGYSLSATSEGASMTCTYTLPGMARAYRDDYACKTPNPRCARKCTINMQTGEATGETCPFTSVPKGECVDLSASQFTA